MFKPILRNRLTAQMKVRYTALRKRVIKYRTAFVKKYQQLCMSLGKLYSRVTILINRYKKRCIRRIKGIYQPILIEVKLVIRAAINLALRFFKKVNSYYLASGKGSFINRQNKYVQMVYKRLTEKSNRNARYWYLHIKLDSLSDLIGYIILFRCFICFLFYFIYFIFRSYRSIFEIFLLFCYRTLIYS